MKTKIVIALSVLLLTTTTADAQLVYRIQYRLPTIDKGVYDALLLLDNTGTGIARVKKYSAEGDSMLIHLNLEEEYSQDLPVDVEPTQMYYRATSQSVVSGKGNMPGGDVLFLFSKDTASGFFEPTGISSIIERDSVIEKLDAVALVDRKQLDENFFLRYFNKGDQFYKNLFTTTTRSLSQAQRKAKIYLLAVANTNDTVIGPSVLKDMNRSVETFSRIASFMGIGLVKTTLSGKDCSKESVAKNLAALRPAPNDIVIFYYSGHGFRKQKDTRRFPYIDLRIKPDNTYMTNSMNMEDIYNTIKSKGARLNLVISDCCNTEVTASNAIAPGPALKRGTEIGWSMLNCMQLFFNDKPQSYLINAADVDQLASSNNNFGGFFSFFFKSAMERNLGAMNNGTNWDIVFKEAKKLTMHKASRTYCAKPYIPENICEQYPIWK